MMSWQNVLVSGCNHCDVVNQTPQIRHIGYRNAVAVSSPKVQISANMMYISNVRYQYWSDTNILPRFIDHGQSIAQHLSRTDKTFRQLPKTFLLRKYQCACTLEVYMTTCYIVILHFTAFSITIKYYAQRTLLQMQLRYTTIKFVTGYNNKAFQSKGVPSQRRRTGYTDSLFCSCGLDTITSIHELYLNIFWRRTCI